MAEKFGFVTSDSWDILLAGLNYPDVPSAESWMPNFTDAWNRLQKFGDTLSNQPGLSLAYQETILEGDLTAIFNGTALPIHPYIEADPVGHWMHGRDWPTGTVVHMTIERPVGNITYSANATMGQAPWNPGDPNDIAANYNLWDPRYDLQPGDVITMTGDGTSTSMTVAALQVTTVDAEANTVSGTADAAEGTLSVWIDGQPNQNVPIVGGHWTADFSPFDLTPGMTGGAAQFQDNRNMTQTDWRAQRPWIQAGVTNQYVDAHEWPMGADLTMTVNGSNPKYAKSGLNSGNPGDLFDTYANFGNVALHTGDVILITDGTTPKSYTVTNLQVQSADPLSNTVSGITTPGARVQVCVNLPGSCITRWATADESTGKWSVFYGAWSDPRDDQINHTLQPGDNGWAAEYNDTGDRTWIDWRLLNPYIEASPYSNWIHARDWPTGTSVTMTFDDLSTSLSPDITSVGTVEHNPGNPGDPNDILAQFNWPSGFAPGPGYEITMTGLNDGLPVTKTLVVADLRVTNVDSTTGTVSGFAIPGSTGSVEVCLNGLPGDCIRRPDVEPSTGAWSVTYNPEILAAGQ